jgi:UDP-galactopyranose mutase
VADGPPPRELPAEIISRLLVRFTFNDFYFNDPFEGLPLVGYAELLRRMLADKTIATHLRADFLGQIFSNCELQYRLGSQLSTPA